MAVKHRLKLKCSKMKPCGEFSFMVGLGEHKEFLGVQLHNVMYVLKSHLAGKPVGLFSEDSSISLAREIYHKVVKKYFKVECNDFARIEEHLHSLALVGILLCCISFHVTSDSMLCCRSHWFS